MPAKSPFRFYVYVLFDRNGVPRYVGKGQRNRWLQHDRADDPNNPAKNEFILETIEAIGSVPKVKVGSELSEEEAFATEKAFIRAIGRFPKGPLLNLTENRNGPSSERIQAWHATKTPEERRAHMAPAIKASAESPIRREMGKTLIQHALAALTPDHHIAAAKRLNAGRTTEDRRAASIKVAAAMTPEERSARSRHAIAVQSVEQLSRTGKRRNEFITPAMRSEIGRKRAAYLTEEQRAKNTQRLIGSQTLEQLSEAGKKGASSLSPEIRSAASKKRAVTLGPERLREISRIAVEARLRKKAERLQASSS